MVKIRNSNRAKPLLRLVVCATLLTILLVLASGSEAKKQNKSSKKRTTEVERELLDDAIIIDANPDLLVEETQVKERKTKPGKKASWGKHRSGRQFLYQVGSLVDYDVDIPEAYPHTNPDFAWEQPTRIGDSCFTPSGDKGVCTHLKTCYKYMEGNDIDDDGYYEGNPELASMLYKSTQGTCSPGGPHRYFDGDSVQVEYPVVDAVCCTGEVNVTSYDELTSRIVGGREARRGQFPYIVALMNNGRQFCGGSLLNSNHVLTAAHCVQHMGPNEVARITVQIGDHNIYSKRDGYSETRRAIRVSRHRQFNSRTLVNDVAVIRLAQSVPFNNFIQPVRLATFTPQAGTAEVAGWGKLAQNRPASNVLMYVQVGIWNNAACQRAYGNLARVANHMVCAGSAPRDSCNGDSGGPLMSGGQQIGIVSWGIGCGSFPGVYTRVASFLDWINRNKNI